MTMFFGAKSHDDLRIPDQKCPYCGYFHDCASPIGDDEDARPSPGDISLCLRCMEVGVYDDKLMVRKATPEELEDFRKSSAWERVTMAQNVKRWMRKGRG